jgi:hypothetical protein
MADHLMSYTRFTALPNNLSEVLPSAEEIKLTRGKPDRNPVASPMASTRITGKKLALEPQDTYNLSLGKSPQSVADPFLGPESGFSGMNELIRKLSHPVLEQLTHYLQGKTALDAEQRRIQQSLGIVGRLVKKLASTQSMVDHVAVRMVIGNRN